MYFRFLPALAICLVLALSACSQGAQQEITTVIPTPQPDRAVVYGKLVNAETQEVLTVDNAAAHMYLSPTIYSDDGRMRVAVLDTNVSPYAHPNEEGVFVFEDVVPGEYAVAVVTPMNQVAARSAEDIEKDLVITLEPGETRDLGTLYTRYP